MRASSFFKTREEVKDYLGHLANYYEVPTPRIIVMPDHPRTAAYFTVVDWAFHVSLPLRKSTARHEFYHYLSNLAKRGEALEEDLADVFSEFEEENLDRAERLKFGR